MGNIFTATAALVMQKFSRMGKAAEGFFTLAVFGRPSTLVNGIVKGPLDYKHVHGLSLDELVKMTAHVAPAQELICFAYDEYRKRNNGMGNQVEELAKLLADQGFCHLNYSEKMAQTFIANLKTRNEERDADVEEMMMPEYIEVRRAIMKKQGHQFYTLPTVNTNGVVSKPVEEKPIEVDSAVSTDMAPRLVHNN